MRIAQNDETQLIVVNARSWREHEKTLALLKILALGRRAIEQGQFKSAEDVFAAIDQDDSQ